MSSSATHVLGEIAEALDAEVSGDGSIVVDALVYPTMAKSATDLAIVMDQGLVEGVANGPIRAAIIARNIALPAGALDGHVRVDDARNALAILLDIFDKPVHAPLGVHPSAVVDASAALGDAVSIGALAYVGPGAVIGRNTIIMPQVTVGAGARIGADCLLHPGARVGERVVIGDRVILQMNACIGADGFSYTTPGVASFESAKWQPEENDTQNLEIRRINSIGTVVLGDDVEVGALASIDRANIGATTIGDGTKIDDLVMIGHNNRIGGNCLMSGQVGISGSCVIGDRVVLAGGAGIADHIKIGDDAVVGAKSCVWRDVGDKALVAGYPALPKKQAFARELNVGRLDRLFRDLAKMKRRLATLEEKQ